MSMQIDPEKIVHRLSQQIGLLTAELAVRDVALEVAHARIAELEQPADPEPAAD